MEHFLGKALLFDTLFVKEKTFQDKALGNLMNTYLSLLLSSELSASSRLSYQRTYNTEWSPL